MKIGTKVSFTRKNGESVRGKVVNVVNAGKGTGKTSKIRPSQATKL